MVSRRAVLGHVAALGGATTLTGCLFGAFSNGSSLAIHMTAVSSSELEPEAVPTLDDLEPRARTVVSEGLSDGTITYGRNPLANGSYVAVDGAYYVATVEANGTEAVERPVLEAEAVSESDGTIGAWEDVDSSDEFTLRCAIQAPDRVYEPPCVVLGGNHSAFWPELQFQYFEPGDMGPYRLDVSQQTVTLDRYEYTFERVAETRSAFLDYAVSERVAIDFSTVGLSAEQRDILETAATEGVYRESPSYSSALQDLERRIQSAGDDRTVYVRFNGSYYEASVDQVYDD